MSYSNDLKMLVSNVYRIDELFTDEDRMIHAIDEDTLYSSDFYNHISKNENELRMLLREVHRITSRIGDEITDLLDMG